MLTATVAIYWFQIVTTANLIVLVISTNLFRDSDSSKSCFLSNYCSNIFLFLFYFSNCSRHISNFFQQVKQQINVLSAAIVTNAFLSAATAVKYFSQPLQHQHPFNKFLSSYRSKIFSSTAIATKFVLSAVISAKTISLLQQLQQKKLYLNSYSSDIFVSNSYISKTFLFQLHQ